MKAGRILLICLGVLLFVAGLGLYFQYITFCKLGYGCEEPQKGVAKVEGALGVAWMLFGSGIILWMLYDTLKYLGPAIKRFVERYTRSSTQ